MSDKKSLLIGFAGTGKTVQKTLTNIKQDAPPIALKVFAEKLGSLSDDTVDSIAVVERTEIVNPPKLTRTLTVSKAQWGPEEFDVNSTKTITLTYDGEWQAVTFSGKIPKCVSSIDQADGVKRIQLKHNGSAVTEDPEAANEYLTITLPGNDLIADATATITWKSFSSNSLKSV